MPQRRRDRRAGVRLRPRARRRASRARSRGGPSSCSIIAMKATSRPRSSGCSTSARMSDQRLAARRPARPPHRAPSPSARAAPAARPAPRTPAAGAAPRPTSGRRPERARRGVGRRGRGSRSRRWSPRLRALLEVMRAPRGRRALPRQHVRDARVRPEPPARAGLRVDRLAHDRVAEAELRGVPPRRRSPPPRARRARPARPPRPARPRRRPAPGRTGRPRPHRRARSASASDESAASSSPRTSRIAVGTPSVEQASCAGGDAARVSGARARASRKKGFPPARS